MADNLYQSYLEQEEERRKQEEAARAAASVSQTPENPLYQSYLDKQPQDVLELARKPIQPDVLSSARSENINGMVDEEPDITKPWSPEQLQNHIAKVSERRKAAIAGREEEERKAGDSTKSADSNQKPIESNLDKTQNLPKNLFSDYLQTLDEQEKRLLKRRQSAELMQGLDMLSGGLARVAPSGQEMYKGEIAQVGKDLEHLDTKRSALTKQQQEENLKRELQTEKLKEKGEQSDLWRQLKRDLGEATAQRQQEKTDLSQTNRYNADFQKMAKELSGAKASSRSAMGKAALNKAAAERIETLIAGRDLNDLDNREIYEVARSLDSLLAQGQPTISGSEHLIPKTGRGSAASIAEFITNTRQGAQASSFLQQMIKTVGREKELADKQLDKYKNELLPGFKHLEQVDKERFNQIVGAASSPSDVPTTSSMEGKTATNSATGEKIIFRNGKWQKL